MNPEQREDFVRDLAVRQLREYRERTPGLYFAGDAAALTLHDAYAVQAEVARLRVAEGDALAGYKIGCLSPRIFELFGMSGPIRGFLYRSELHRTGVALSAAAYADLAIEGEMAIRIGEHGGIAATFPVIELHNYVFRGARKTLQELVANNGLHAGAVLPAEAGLGSGLGAPAREEISVAINGEVVERGPLWAMAGGAEGATDWLARHLAEHGMRLEPGHIVLTGTPLGLHPITAGDVVKVSAAGLGQVEIAVLP